MKRVIVLGATGSIGVQALKVIAASPDLYVAGLSCDRSVALLLEQAISLRVNDVAVADERAAATIPGALYPELSVRAGSGAAARPSPGATRRAWPWWARGASRRSPATRRAWACIRCRR